MNHVSPNEELGPWTPRSRTGEAAALAAILLLALGVRLLGIMYCLPTLVGYEDEANVIASAASFGATHSLRPIYFDYPALFQYVLAGGFGVYFAVGYIAGWFHSISDFAAEFLTQTGSFLLIGRVLSAIFGLAAVVVVYRLGRQYWGVGCGLLAALFLAIAPSHVMYSKWAKPDTLAALLTVLSLGSALAIYAKGKWQSYVLAGIWAGLATAAKYNAAPIVIPIFVAHLMRCRSEGLPFFRSCLRKELLLAAGCTIVFFFIGTPYFFLDFKASMDGLRLQTTHSRLGEVFAGGAVPYLWVAESFIYGTPGLGFLWLISLAGILLVRRPEKWILMAHLGPMVLWVGSVRTGWEHYLLPAMPTLCLASAAVALAAVEQVRHLRLRRIALACVFILCFTATVKTWQEGDFRTLTPTTLVAKDWIEQHIPANSWVALDKNLGVPITRDIRTMQRRDINVGSYIRPEISERLDRYYKTVPFYNVVILYELSTDPALFAELKGTPYENDPYIQFVNRKWLSLEELRAQRVQYLVLTSTIYGRYLTGSGPEEGNPLHGIYLRTREYFRQLLAPGNPGLELLHKIEPSAKHPGPIVLIFRVL